MDAVHEGGCLCGDIRYRARGAPVQTLACHCTFCQRFTGSAFNVEALFPQRRIEFRGAGPSSYEHRSDGSGQRVRLHFCRRCGTTVWLTFERFPGLVAVTRGSLDEPDRVTVDAHLFTRSAQSGVAFPAGVDCYAQHMMDLDGRPRAAQRHAQPTMRPAPAPPDGG